MAGPDRLGKVMRDFESLKLRCCACGHEARWTKRRAIAIFGPDATPRTIRRATKCSKCGEKRSDVSI
jgi:hypothetical protein